MTFFTFYVRVFHNKRFCLVIVYGLLRLIFSVEKRFSFGFADVIPVNRSSVAIPHSALISIATTCKHSETGRQITANLFRVGDPGTIRPLFAAGPPILIEFEPQNATKRCLGATLAL